MLRCGCGMMIECEVKTGQIVESIEHTGREEGETVGRQTSNEDGKVFEVDIVVEDVWRKGGELIGIEVHE